MYSGKIIDQSHTQLIGKFTLLKELTDCQRFDNIYTKLIVSIFKFFFLNIKYMFIHTYYHITLILAFINIFFAIHLTKFIHFCVRKLRFQLEEKKACFASIKHVLVYTVKWKGFTIRISTFVTPIILIFVFNIFLFYYVLPQALVFLFLINCLVG